MSCTKNNGLFNTDFDHTFDRQNSRCQGEINEVEELRRFIEEITQETITNQVDKALEGKLKGLDNRVTTLERLVRELQDQIGNMGEYTDPSTGETYRIVYARNPEGGG